MSIELLEVRENRTRESTAQDDFGVLQTERVNIIYGKKLKSFITYYAFGFPSAYFKSAITSLQIDALFAAVFFFSQSPGTAKSAKT